MRSSLVVAVVVAISVSIGLARLSPDLLPARSLKN